MWHVISTALASTNRIYKNKFPKHSPYHWPVKLPTTKPEPLNQCWSGWDAQTVMFWITLKCWNNLCLCILNWNTKLNASNVITLHTACVTVFKPAAIKKKKKKCARITMRLQIEHLIYFMYFTLLEWQLFFMHLLTELS